MKTLSKAEYARYRGVTPAAVSNALRRGLITPTAAGKINPVTADAEWEHNRRRHPPVKIQGPVGSPPATALSEEIVDAADLKIWAAIEKPQGNLERAVTDWVGLFIVDTRPHAALIDNLMNLVLFITECAAHRDRVNEPR